MKLSMPAKVSTFAKYLFSYMAIFTVLIGGFFMILRSTLMDKYHTQRTGQIRLQLSSLEKHLNTELTFLTHIDNLITSNRDILLANYRAESKYRMATYEELEQYESSSSLISNIVYYSKFGGHVFSPSVHVEYKEGKFYLWDGDNRSAAFDPAPYMNEGTGQLIWLNETGVRHLLYFPPNNASAKYIWFYMLDTQVIQSQLNTLLSQEIPGVALVDPEGNVVIGINFESRKVPAGEGIFTLEDDRTLCVSSGMRSGFRICAMISESFLSEQVNETFLSAWLSLLALSVLGIVLIYSAMSMTYKPLNSFIRSIAPSAHRGQNYLDLLHQNYADLIQQRKQLQENLQNYRTFVRKDLLGSVLTQQFAVSPATLDQILAAFSPSGQVVALKTSQTAGILDRLVEGLGAEGSCLCLSRTETGALYLAFLPGEREKLVAFKALCAGIFRDTGCLFALSEPSGSIMDLPMLCENASAACTAWPQTPVAEYRVPGRDTNPFLYPHEALNRLSDLLRDSRFAQARESIQDIFTRLDQHSAQSTLPSYFSNCIVLDLLTILSNSMSQAKIDFDAYSGTFYEAIYLCRDFQPEESTLELQSVISELLFFYEKEASNRLSHVAPLQQMMERNYCQPEFSISVIADTYHVSISRMSVLFKKEMGRGFAECLWQLRQEKAQELLRATQLSIDEISVAVGYLNPNSFRRKFKQETGLSPSQYRDSVKK